MQPRPVVDPLGLEAVTISTGVAVALVCAAGAVAGDAVVLAVNGRKSTPAQLVAAAAIGCTGGIGVLAGYTVAAGSAISNAVAGPALWPVVPGAVGKLQKLADKCGTTSGEILTRAMNSNARFVDMLEKIT